jgi:hypothetical protein
MSRHLRRRSDRRRTPGPWRLNRRRRVLKESSGALLTASIAAISVAGALLTLTASAVAAAPANDNFANAQVLPSTSAVTVAGTNVGATAQSGEPHGKDFLSRDRSTVWYQWTAPSAADTSIDACATSVHLVLAVYTKDADPVPPFTNLSELGAIGEGTDPGGCATENGALGVLNSPSSGQTYYIQLAGWSGAAAPDGDRASITLNLTQASSPPTTPPASTLAPPSGNPAGKKSKKKCAKHAGASAAKKKCKKK